MSLARLLPILFFLASSSLVAQTATLSGRVTDESGAVVPGATIRLESKGGPGKLASTKSPGAYSLANLPPGEYTVTASAPHLALPEPVKVTLRAGANTLDLQLKVESLTQKVTVEENAAPGVTVETAGNASATIIAGADLASLSDDPQDLADDLQALAGNLQA